MSLLASSPFGLYIFKQAKSPLDKRTDTGIFDPIEDLYAHPARHDHAMVSKQLQLVRYRLRLHPEPIAQVGNTQLSLPHERMEQPQARVVCKQLEEFG